LALSNSSALDTILESLYKDEFESNLDFDPLPHIGDNQDNDSNGEVYPYPDFKKPLGSVKSVSSSIQVSDICEYTSILMALIKYPQGNLEEIQLKDLPSTQEEPGGQQDHKAQTYAT